MKIKNQSFQSFGMKKLYSAKLQNSKFSQKNILKDVFISELEFQDKDFMQKRLRKWKQSSCGTQIINAFLGECKENYAKENQTKKFFVVEVPKKSGKAQVKAMCMTMIDDNKTKLIYLQSDRELNPKRVLQGLGSCIMYAIVQYANQMNKKLVQLTALENAEQFYKNIGFKKFGHIGADFVLAKVNYNDFAKNMEEKYFIKNL